MSLQPLPWQHPVWELMMAGLRKQSLAHAFLLKGMPGIGKLHFARAFAGQLLCESPADNLPCMKCKGCSLIQSGNHPDFLMVEPDDAGKPIKIDQVRKLNDFAHKTAQQGGRRIIIVSPAEAMNVNASNALLKCLEEPGANTVFFLVSHRSGDMLPTIRSRCQTLSLPVPQHEVAITWLREQLSDGEDEETLLNLAAGAPLRAVAMSEQKVLEQREKLIKAVESLFRGELTPVELAKTWQGDNILLVLEWLAGWLDDIVRLSLTDDPKHVRNSDLLTLLKYLAGKSEVRQVMELRDWLLNYRQVMAGGGNLNPQLLAEGVFCRLLELSV